MMTKMNIHEAKTHLSELIKKAMNGEEVIIAKAGEPAVRLVAINQAKNDWWGMDDGKGWIADDFDDLPEELMAAFYGEDDESSD
ncbi:MAG: type II toxin-antitoxin system Phd/YefM family antitoxin [Pyrinomonadaceae bacterium]